MPFPPGFLIGAATSAYQVEGNNVSTDWWEWEHRRRAPISEPSGDACDHYHRYTEDIGILADVGMNAYRFTLEWARIEPERDLISRAALAHYRRMLQTCIDLGVTPVVTLHHFTLPRWVAEGGGWCDPLTAVRFQHFVDVVASELGDLLSWVVTTCEPRVLFNSAYIIGAFPPGRIGDTESQARAIEMISAAHHAARTVLHDQIPGVKVGMALSMLAADAEPGAEERALAFQAETYGPFLPLVGDDDFVGVQCYTTQHVGPDGPTQPARGVERTQMGWEYAPEAAALMCRQLATLAPGLPLVVTENGVATRDDERRVTYIRRSLAALDDAIADGADIRGYLHWSLLDNYEWNLGYRTTFGLISCDPVTFERTVKPSARVLGEIARTVPPGAS